MPIHIQYNMNLFIISLKNKLFIGKRFNEKTYHF